MTKQTTPQTVRVHVPMKFSVQGGRKAIFSEIAPAARIPAKTEDALLKALAKAFRWCRQIETGEYASITELAKARGVNDSYACRMLRPTLLAPEIIIAILDGRQTTNLTLKRLTRPLPIEWNLQPAALADGQDTPTDRPLGTCDPNATRSIPDNINSNFKPGF